MSPSHVTTFGSFWRPKFLMLDDNPLPHHSILLVGGGSFWGHFTLKSEAKAREQNTAALPNVKIAGLLSDHQFPGGWTGMV